MEWRDSALCAQVGSALFFPEKNEANTTRVAKSVCHRCDVTDECLDYALSISPVQGVWGGTTEREREKMLKARKVA